MLLYPRETAQDSVTLCTLGIGTAFGESILNDTPRHSTVVTREYCELLRVEQKDFKILWEVRMIGLLSEFFTASALPVDDVCACVFDRLWIIFQFNRHFSIATHTTYRTQHVLPPEYCHTIILSRCAPPSPLDSNNRRIIHSSRTCSLERSSKRTSSIFPCSHSSLTILLRFLLYPHLNFILNLKLISADDHFLLL